LGDAAQERGGAADYWVDDKEMDMSNALDSFEVWNKGVTIVPG
jgi:hypothetical protein